MKIIQNIISNNSNLLLCAMAGIFTGLLFYTVYMSRAYSYLSDDPSACVNCHIMSSYYESWEHSSHANRATCNDCHVPHNNIVSKYAFKAVDGIYHAAVFTLRKEPQVIRARSASKQVIMENCIRCHTMLNTELVNTGMLTYTDLKKEGGMACWDCHTQTPHTNISNIGSSYGVMTPLPKSPVPGWLKEMIK